MICAIMLCVYLINGCIEKISSRIANKKSKGPSVVVWKNGKIEFSGGLEKIIGWLLTETLSCAYRTRMLKTLISMPQNEVRAQVANGFQAARA
jgi:hypothetical protein